MTKSDKRQTANPKLRICPTNITTKQTHQHNTTSPFISKITHIMKELLKQILQQLHQSFLKHTTTKSLKVNISALARAPPLVSVTGFLESPYKYIEKVSSRLRTNGPAL